MARTDCQCSATAPGDFPHDCYSRKPRHWAQTEIKPSESSNSQFAVVCHKWSAQLILTKLSQAVHSTFSKLQVLSACK